MRIFMTVAIGSAALLAGCGGERGESQTAAVCEGGGIVVSNAWARTARAGQPASAAYLTLCNAGEAADALVAVSMDGVEAAEIHITSMSADGIASMAPADKIALPAGQSVSLEPGGAHVMLIGLERALSSEDAPTIRLEFENAPPQEIALEVRDAMGGHQH